MSAVTLQPPPKLTPKENYLFVTVEGRPRGPWNSRITHKRVYIIYIYTCVGGCLCVHSYVCRYIYAEKRRCCLCHEGVAKMKGMGGVSFSGAPLTAATRRVRDRTGTVVCVPRGRRAEFSPVPSGLELPLIQSFRPRDTTPVCMHLYIYKCKYYNARIYRVYQKSEHVHNTSITTLTRDLSPEPVKLTSSKVKQYHNQRRAVVRTREHRRRQYF